MTAAGSNDNMSDPVPEKAVTSARDDSAEDDPVSVPSREPVDHDAASDEKSGKGGVLDAKVTAAAPAYEPNDGLCDTDSENVVIVTGADAAAHLLPLRDDGDPALTFRGLFLASCLACFQAVMKQIYNVRFFFDPRGF